MDLILSFLIIVKSELRLDNMKCELLSEYNLALMLDFVDDENTKYDIIRDDDWKVSSRSNF